MTHLQIQWDHHWYECEFPEIIITELYNEAYNKKAEDRNKYVGEKLVMWILYGRLIAR